MLKLGVDVYKLGSRCLNLESMFKLESMLKLGVDVNLESMSTWSRCQLGVDVNLESMFKLESMSTWSRSKPFTYFLHRGGAPAELSWSLYGNRDIKVLGKSDLHSAAILGTMLNFLSKILILSTLVYIIFQ